MRHFFRNVKETLKLVSRGSSQDVIRVCPVCLEDTLITQTSFLTFIAPTIYLCSNCQYRGPLYAEVPVEDFLKLKKLKEQSNEHEVLNVEI